MEIWKVIDVRSGEVKAQGPSGQVEELYLNKNVGQPNISIIKGDFDIKVHDFALERYSDYTWEHKRLVREKGAQSDIYLALSRFSMWMKILNSRGVRKITEYSTTLDCVIGRKLAESVVFAMLVAQRNDCRLYCPMNQHEWKYAYTDAHNLAKETGIPYFVAGDDVLGVIAVCPEPTTVVPSGFDIRMNTRLKRKRK